MKTNSLLVTLFLALSAQADVVSDASAILTSLPACSYGCVAQIPGFVANLNVEMITKVCSNWAADSPVFYNCMAKSGCAGTLSATTNTTVAKFQALCPQVLGTTATTVSALASASSSTYGGPVAPTVGAPLLAESATSSPAPAAQKNGAVANMLESTLIVILALLL
ncbi:hypothetical protein HDU99_009097 [Rhizoclosmatium hyalinum]|nr:hypothetical protein HDU99_009097 [Rhizoclosmatium hyalinum]